MPIATKDTVFDSEFEHLASNFNLTDFRPIPERIEPERLVKAAGEVAVGAVERTTDLLNAPGDAFKGKLTPDQITDAGIGIAGMAATGSFPLAGMKPGLGMFGGMHGKINAGELDLAITARSRLMNEDPLKVYKETGLFRGPDDLIRFELSDKAAKLKTDKMREILPDIWGKGPTYGLPITEKIKMGDILDHPELYRHYPDIADMEVNPIILGGWKSKGRYTSDDKIQIAAADEKAFLSTILHEVQHAVQAREGFAPGSSPDYWMTAPTYFKELKGYIEQADVKAKKAFDEFAGPPDKDGYGKSIYTVEHALEKTMDGRPVHSFEKELLYELQEKNPDLMRLMKALTEAKVKLRNEEDIAYTNYRKTYGEVESRMTQSRQKMSDEQRRENPPWINPEFTGAYPEGTIEGKYILRDGGKKFYSESTEGPINMIPQLEEFLHSYAEGKISAKEVQRVFKKNGWSINLRGNKSEAEAYDPSGKQHYLSF